MRTRLSRTVRIAAVALAAACLVPALVVPGPAAAAPVCVAVHGRCRPTLALALADSRDGDVVLLPAGRWAGGVTVTRSITLRGAGPGLTVITGGGPVLTIGTAGAGVEPVVTVAGVTVTGGRTSSSAAAQPGVVAAGGGIEIPPSAGGPGATVTLVDSVVSGNRAAPRRSVGPEPGQRTTWPRCPEGFCPFAAATGGGIDSWGSLTVLRSRVTGNEASGGMVSDADGGGITNHGTLVVQDSAVDGNRALAGPPNGRFAEGGGIFSDSGASVTVRRSSVSRNQARLVSRFPYTLDDGTVVDTLANSGGIHIGDDTSLTLESSAVDGNRLTFLSPRGQWGVINSGIQVGRSRLTVRDSSVSHNRLVAYVSTTADSGPLGGAVEWDDVATVSGLRVVGNTTTVQAAHGAAGVAGTVASLAILVQGTDPGASTVRDSIVSGNVVEARSPDGPVTVVGAGWVNDAALSLQDVVVRANTGAGHGSSGVLQGGGLWNGPAFGSPRQPAARLTVSGGSITANTLVAAGGSAVIRQGGGLFTAAPVVLAGAVLARNRPDDCSGCDVVASAASSSRPTLGKDRR